MRKIGRALALLLIALTLAGCAASGGTVTTRVSGALDHDFSRGRVFYEHTASYLQEGVLIPDGYQIYVEQVGPGAEHHLLVVALPNMPLHEGEYAIAGPYDGGGLNVVRPAAEYFAATGGTSRVFNQNVDGQMTVEVGTHDVLTAHFTFSAAAQGSDERVTVEGQFHGLPYRQGGATAVRPAAAEARLFAVVGALLLVTLLAGAAVAARASRSP